MAVSINDLDYNWLTYLEALYKIVEKVNEIIGVVNDIQVASYESGDVIISTIEVITIPAEDDTLYYYTLDCSGNINLTDPTSYSFYLYNDTQGIMIPLENRLTRDNALCFISNAIFDTESEFIDDCIILYKKII